MGPQFWVCLHVYHYNNMGSELIPFDMDLSKIQLASNGYRYLFITVLYICTYVWKGRQSINHHANRGNYIKLLITTPKLLRCALVLMWDSNF